MRGPTHMSEEIKRYNPVIQTPCIWMISMATVGRLWFGRFPRLPSWKVWHLINWSKVYKQYQDCMENISPPSEETILHYLLCLSPNTLKYAFFHIEGNLGNLQNQRRPTVAMDIIQIQGVWITGLYLLISSDICVRTRNVLCFVVYYDLWLL